MTMKEAMEKLSVRELAELIEDRITTDGYGQRSIFGRLFDASEFYEYHCTEQRCNDYKEGEFGEAECVILGEYYDSTGVDSLKCWKCAKYYKEGTIRRIMELLNTQVDYEES